MSERKITFRVDEETANLLDDLPNKSEWIREAIELKRFYESMGDQEK